jgi:anti-sigma B factor antagonist
VVERLFLGRDAAGFRWLRRHVTLAVEREETMARPNDSEPGVVDNAYRLQIVQGPDGDSSLGRELAPLVEREGATVIVDLRALTRIDTTTLGCLVRAVKRIRATGGDISLVCDNPEIRRTFELTGLDRVFEIHDRPGVAARPRPPADAARQRESRRSTRIVGGRRW